MAFALSFTPEFFWGDAEMPPDELPRRARPTSVYEAVLCLTDDRWAELAREVFHCDPDVLDPEMVVIKVQETDTCRNLDSPVEVFIDSDGWHTLLVYDSRKEQAP